MRRTFPIRSIHRYRSRLLAAALLAVGSTVAIHAADAPKIAFPDASPNSTVEQRVGLTDVEITHARPGMKGRKIFGGLVPFGHVWRTGANTATRISFSTDVKLNGVTGLAEQPEAFWMHYRKGLLPAKMGDKAGASAAAKQSVALAATKSGELKDEYTRLNEALIASVR